MIKNSLSTLTTKGLTLMVLVIALASCQSSSQKQEVENPFFDQPPPPLQAGQIFTYQHQGPCPWGSGSSDCTGQRIVRVIDQSDGLWRIEEQFTQGGTLQTGFYDKKFRLHRHIVDMPDDDINIIYTPPAPIRYLELRRNEEKRYEYQQQLYVESEEEPIGIANVVDTTKRASFNIRIITPAGAYLSRAFNSQVQIDLEIRGQRMSFSAELETFWSDDISWFVKEQGNFQPLIADGEIVQPGYRTMSELASFEPMTK